MLRNSCETLTPEAEYRERPASNRPGLPQDRLLYLSIPNLSEVFHAYQEEPLAGLVDTLRFADQAIESIQPDLIVVDQIVGVAQLARSRGIPVVQLTNAPLLPGFGSWEPWREPPAESPEQATRAEALLHQAFGALGIQTDSTLDDQLDGDLIAVSAMPDFGSTDDALHIVFPDSFGYPTLDAVCEDSPTRVVIYLSQAGEELLGPVIEGVSGAGLQPLVVDRSPDDPSPSLSRPGVESVGPVDLASALKESVAIVHQGGIATTGVAFATGTPQVAIPRNSEQEGNIRTVERLGAGIHLPISQRPLERIEMGHGYTALGHSRPDQLAKRLGEALQTLTSEATYREGALAAGERQRGLPGVDHLANEMETLL